ncbi:exodeoxyribonuclease [Planococcus citri]|uniref:exodeoxyribonuclease n=1 Tax=Planococcus citri TaxID=170843 RepID=UPI0031F7814B
MKYFDIANFVFVVSSLCVVIVSIKATTSDCNLFDSNLSVCESHNMPRKSKKTPVVAEAGDSKEVESKAEPKLENDSDEEQNGNEEVLPVKKPRSKKAAKSKGAAGKKPESKKDEKAPKDDSNSSDESIEENSKSKKDDKKTKNEESNKRKRAKDDDDKTDSKKPKQELLNQVSSDLDSLVVTNTKCTADGKSSNFKIASWNVAGLRAWIKKNGLDYIKKEQADIVCLQETKCSESKLPPEAKVKGYHTYWCSGIKEGYAGVALYSKEKPLNVKYGLGKQEYDSEGRLITAEYEKFYVVAIYVPNAGQGLKNLSKRMQWDIDFRNYLKSLDEKKPVLICGDMNVSHQAIDLANPKTNTKSPGFTQEERDGMTELLEAGFVDSFRNLYPEKTGAYTYWTYFANARKRNVGWRLDYFIVSKRFVDNVCDNVIRSEVYGSDHCPIVLFASV